MNGGAFADPPADDPGLLESFWLSADAGRFLEHAGLLVVLQTGLGVEVGLGAHVVLVLVVTVLEAAKQ